MTTSNEYLLLLPQGNVKSLQDKFREHGGFYNGLGYAFPTQSDSFLKELVASLPGTKIHRLPLGQNQSFAAFQQSHKAAFFQEKLLEIDRQLLSWKKQNGLEDISESGVDAAPIPAAQKQLARELLQEHDKIKQALDWAAGIEKALSTVQSTSIELKFISEISPDYFNKEPPAKPVLLSFWDDSPKKVPFLHKEITAMLVAEGGSGKTHLMALLASCVPTGVPFLKQFAIESPGAACLIMGENSEKDTHRLLFKIRQYLGDVIKANASAKNPAFQVDKNALDRLTELLAPVSVHGKNAALIDRNGTPTPYFYSLLDALVAREPKCGWQFIALDPASRFMGAEAETDNAMATAYITCLEKISDALKGKPTVMFAHHKSKAGTNESSGQTAARGSSALTDGARSQFNLNKTDEPNVTIFQTTKTNFTPPIGKFKIKKLYDGIPEFDGWVKNDSK